MNKDGLVRTDSGRRLGEICEHQYPAAIYLKRHSELSLLARYIHKKTSATFDKELKRK